MAANVGPWIACNRCHALLDADLNPGRVRCLECDERASFALPGRGARRVVTL